MPTQSTLNTHLVHKTTTIADRVKKLRTDAKLTQAGFAKALHFSRDYISQIENGREPSDRFKQQIELIERVGIESLGSLPRADYVGMARIDKDRVGEKDHAAQGTPDALRKEIRGLIEAAIAQAGDDVGELGWLRGQVIRHTTQPVVSSETGKNKARTKVSRGSGIERVILPSQTTPLSTETGLPIQGPLPGARSA